MKSRQPRSKDCRKGFKLPVLALRLMPGPVRTIIAGTLGRMQPRMPEMIVGLTGEVSQAQALPVELASGDQPLLEPGVGPQAGIVDRSHLLLGQPRVDEHLRVLATEADIVDERAVHGGVGDGLQDGFDVVLRRFLHAVVPVVLVALSARSSPRGYRRKRHPKVAGN